MKKLASIFLIVLYATASSGASFHFHYCMGKFRGIGLAAGSQKECDQCGMKKGGNGCCSDIVKTFKVPADQASSSINFDFTQYAYTLPHTESVLSRATLPAKEVAFILTTGPPVPLPVPIYLRDCTFRV